MLSDMEWVHGYTVLHCTRESYKTGDVQRRTKGLSQWSGLIQSGTTKTFFQFTRSFGDYNLQTDFVNELPLFCGRRRCLLYICGDTRTSMAGGARRGAARRGAAVTIDTSANTNLLCWIFMSWAPDLCVQTLRPRKPVRCNFYANQFLYFASEITLFSTEFISRLSWTSGNNTVEAYESLRSKSEVIRAYNCVRGGIR